MESCSPQTSAAGVRTLVLNGWAASRQAWKLCTFRRDALFSYIDQLDGLPERFIEDAVAVQPGIRFIVVGWSMGGSSALRLACRYRDRIAGLVLVAATPRMMEDRPAGWRGMSPRRLDALHRGLVLTHGEGFFGVPEGRPNPYQMDSDENLLRGLRYLTDTDVRADLERLAPEMRFPVAIFQSERDGIVRPENAAYLKRLFPCAAVAMVPGTEHALPISIPGSIDAAVQKCRLGGTFGIAPTRKI